MKTVYIIKLGKSFVSEDINTNIYYSKNINKIKYFYSKEQVESFFKYYINNDKILSNRPVKVFEIKLIYSNNIF